jgi:hypothetical protein
MQYRDCFRLPSQHKPRWDYHRYHCGQVGRVVVITKVFGVSDLLTQARHHPQKCFPAILKLASSEDWKEREVAATLLVEASKKTPNDVVAEMTRWADHSNPNVRRTASEGLRDVARKQPELVLTVIPKLKADPNLYVKKSVANVLRNAGNYHPEFVLTVSERLSTMPVGPVRTKITERAQWSRGKHSEETPNRCARDHSSDLVGDNVPHQLFRNRCPAE